MIEIVDNGFQLAVTTGCAIWAGILALRDKSEHYLILACFYGTFALGLLFWLMYLIIMTYTPKFFYVSDMSWMASFMFLLLLNLSVAAPGERGYRPLPAGLVVVFLLGLTVHLCLWGDYVVTIIWCGLITGCGYFSMRGLLYARKQTGAQRRMQSFHIAVLFIVLAEFTLWITSCYFKDSNLTNPYFWCDFALTAGLFALLPTLKKAVDS